jgi:hypothetical protein
VGDQQLDFLFQKIYAFRKFGSDFFNKNVFDEAKNPIKSLFVRAFIGIFIGALPFLVLEKYLFLFRAHMDTDTIISVGVMAINVKIGVIFVILSWIIDGIGSMGFIYHFESALEFMKASKYSGYLHITEFLYFSQFVVLILFISCLYICARLVRRRPAIFFINFAFAVFLVGLDMINGTSAFSSGDVRIVPMNIAGSPSIRVFSLLGNPNQGSLQTLAQNETVQGFVDIPGWAAAHADSDASILLVVVESLGAPVARDLRSWLDGKVLVPGHTRETTEIPFKGSTTSGELRSLCRLKGNYSEITNPPDDYCVPRQLSALGWKTAGFHGFTRYMFDRASWWPLLGLTETYFLESPLLASAPRCPGGLIGVCDVDVINAALDYMRAGKRFAYVLTLNTHIPIDAQPIPDDLRQACKAAQATQGTCEYVAALGGVLSSISERVVASNRNDLIVILGDHAPPFAQRDSRVAFRPSVVPAYVLYPDDPQQAQH